MRERIRWSLLALAAALLVLGIYHGAQRTQVDGTNGSGSAALGLMLLDEADGVYVLAVTAASTADAAGIQPGDYIIAVDDEPLSAAAGLEDISPDGSGRVSLTIRRQSQVLHIVLQVK